MKRILALLAVSACAAFAQPNITAVQDGGAYTNNVAQGSVFVVKGTNLSAAGYSEATAPSYPTQIGGVGISFTAVSGGNVVNALMVYLYNQGGVNQLAAVLPSNTALGAYDVRVVNGSATSNAFRTQVVARKPGIVTADGSGSGQAQATLSGALILARNSNIGAIGQFTTRAAHLGERVDLWGTGIGADASSDTGGTSGDQTAAGQIRVLINGAEVTPLYAGRSQGYPGLDQIVFTIPQNTAPGCSVSIQVRAGGTLSNTTSIPVAASGDACTTSNPGGGGGNSGGLTQGQIDAILARGVYRSGGVSVSRTTVYTAATLPGTSATVSREDIASGSFSSVSGPDLAKMFTTNTLPPGFALPEHGVCNFFDTTTIPIVVPNVQYRYLDAGASLSVTGPAGARTIAKSTHQQGNITYHASVGNGSPGNYMDPGSYTFSGPGGPDVGSFNLSVDVPQELVWTNRTAVSVINRAGGVTVTWTGDEPSQLVFISGTSIVADLSGSVTGASFQCYANQSAGSFNIPASVLTRLPATTETNVPGIGSFVIVPGTLSLSSVGKITFGSASGLDSLTVGSTSTVASTVTFR